MATVSIITNPFNPAKNREVFRDLPRQTIRNFVDNFLGKPDAEFEYPTVCFFNGEPLLRRHWSTKEIGTNDTVQFAAKLAGLDPITVALIALTTISVGFSVYSLTNQPDVPNVNIEEPESVYSLGGNKNKSRFGEPIESAYGKNRLYLSYAALPFTRFKNDEQFLYQIFSFGHGEFDIATPGTDIKIEDTPIEDYNEVQYEVVEAGDTPSTLKFYDDVITSQDVDNIELQRSDEGGGFTSWFTINPIGTRLDDIEIDLAWPQGVYKMRNNGEFENYTVWWEFQVREIDDSDNVLSTFLFFASGNTLNRKQNSPIRKTYKFSDFAAGSLPDSSNGGRYQIRGRRTDTLPTGDSTEKNTRGKTIWAQCRGLIESSRTYPVKTLRILSRATNNLNSRTQNRINVTATRKLPIWNGSSWSTATATRNPVWAFCDIFKAAYSTGLSDASLDLSGLLTLATSFDNANPPKTFDFVFEKKMPVWDAAKLIGSVIRCTPILNGSTITLVEDKAQSTPISLFGPHNIVSGSFQIEYAMAQFNESDGTLIEYLDETVNRKETVTALLSGESGNYLENFSSPGQGSRTWAYRNGLYRRSVARYRRNKVSFESGMEGQIPIYGDLVAVSHDMPTWGQSGHIVSIDSTATEITLSEEVTFPGGQAVIAFSTKTGGMIGPFNCSSTADPKTVELAAPVNDSLLAVGNGVEPSRFGFGESSTFSTFVLVGNVQASDEERVTIEGSIYTDDPYTYDTQDPPAIGQPSLPPDPRTASLDIGNSLEVEILPTQINWIMASWSPVFGADRYEVQEGFDGTEWVTLGFTESLWRMIPARPTTMYVRVRALQSNPDGTERAGAWSNVWSGLAIPQLQQVPSVTVTSRAAVDGGLQLEVGWDETGGEFLINEGRVFIRIYLTADPEQTAEYSAKFSAGSRTIPFRPGEEGAYHVEVWHAVEIMGLSITGPLTPYEDSSGYIAVTVNSDEKAPGEFTLPSGGITSYDSDLYELTLDLSEATPPTEPDYVGFIVDVDVAGGGYQELGRYAKGTQRVVDKYVGGVGGAQTYTYRIRTYDESGNISSGVTDSYNVPQLPTDGGTLPTISTVTGFNVTARASTASGKRFYTNWTQDGANSNERIRIEGHPLNDETKLFSIEHALGTSGFGSSNLDLPVVSGDSANGVTWVFRAYRGEEHDGITWWSLKSTDSAVMARYTSPNAPTAVSSAYNANAYRARLVFRESGHPEVKETRFEMEDPDGSGTWVDVGAVPEGTNGLIAGDPDRYHIVPDIYPDEVSRNIAFRMKHVDRDGNSSNYADFANITVNPLAFSCTGFAENTTATRTLRFTWATTGNGNVRETLAFQIWKSGDLSTSRLEYATVEDGEYVFENIGWTGTAIVKVWRGYIINGRTVWSEASNRPNATVSQYAAPPAPGGFSVNYNTVYQMFEFNWTVVPTTSAEGGVRNYTLWADRGATGNNWEVIASYNQNVNYTFWPKLQEEADVSYNFRIETYDYENQNSASFSTDSQTLFKLAEVDGLGVNTSGLYRSAELGWTTAENSTAWIAVQFYDKLEPKKTLPVKWFQEKDTFTQTILVDGLLPGTNRYMVSAWRVTYFGTVRQTSAAVSLDNRTINNYPVPSVSGLLKHVNDYWRFSFNSPTDSDNEIRVEFSPKGSTTARTGVAYDSGSTHDVVLLDSVKETVNLIYYEHDGRFRGLPSSSIEFVKYDSQGPTDWNNGASPQYLFDQQDVVIQSDEIFISGHQYNTGDMVKIVAGGTLPSPLVNGGKYYVIDASANYIQLSETEGGSAINLTTIGGAGTHQIKPLFLTLGWTESYIGYSPPNQDRNVVAVKRVDGSWFDDSAREKSVSSGTTSTRINAPDIDIIDYDIAAWGELDKNVAGTSADDITVGSLPIRDVWPKQ